MGIHRSARRRAERAAAANQKAVNAPKKAKERARRDARMIDIIKSSQPPYAPAVLSWMSAKLGKKAGRISSEDIATLTS